MEVYGHTQPKTKVWLSIRLICLVKLLCIFFYFFIFSGDRGMSRVILAQQDYEFFFSEETDRTVT